MCRCTSISPLNSARTKLIVSFLKWLSTWEWSTPDRKTLSEAHERFSLRKWRVRQQKGIIACILRWSMKVPKTDREMPTYLCLESIDTRTYFLWFSVMNSLHADLLSCWSTECYSLIQFNVVCTMLLLVLSCTLFSSETGTRVKKLTFTTLSSLSRCRTFSMSESCIDLPATPARLTPGCKMILWELIRWLPL